MLLEIALVTLTPSRQSGRFRHAIFKLVLEQSKATFRLKRYLLRLRPDKYFLKKIVCVFSVNDHVAVQASLSDL